MIIEHPIFIVGLPRSGSTLWLNLFAQNPKLCRMGEMFYLTPWRKDFRFFLKRNGKGLRREEDVGRVVELMFSRKMLPGITDSFWYYDIAKVNDSALKERIVKRIIESDRSIGSIFKTLLEEIAAFKGYNRYCMKFPVYVNHIPDLLEWYPNCKIVHITRDPRATAASRTNDPQGTKRKLDKYPMLSPIIKEVMIYFVILQYVWTSKLHEKYKHLKNYKLFRYEDLLSDPKMVIKNLCQFCEIEFVSEMLEPKEGQPSSLTGRKQKGFYKEAATHWRKALSPFNERVVTFLTRSSMRRFEFDPEKHPVYRGK